MTTSSTRPTVARDTWHVLIRELKPVARGPFTLIFSLVQPLVFLGLFAPLLVAQVAHRRDLPLVRSGMLIVMIVLFGTGAVAPTSSTDDGRDQAPRLVAPPAHPSSSAGRSRRSSTILIQALLIVLLSMIFGFRFNPVGLLIGLLGNAGCVQHRTQLTVLRPGPRGRDRESAVLGRPADPPLPLLILSGMLLPLEGPLGCAPSTVTSTGWSRRNVPWLPATSPTRQFLWGWVAASLLQRSV